PEFPLRERLAAGGGVFQSLDRRFGVAGAQIVDAGAQRLLRALEELEGNSVQRVGLQVVEREGGRRTGQCEQKCERGELSRRTRSRAGLWPPTTPAQRHPP